MILTTVKVFMVKQWEKTVFFGFGNGMIPQRFFHTVYIKVTASFISLIVLCHCNYGVSIDVKLD